MEVIMTQEEMDARDIHGDEFVDGLAEMMDDYVPSKKEIMIGRINRLIGAITSRPMLFYVAGAVDMVILLTILKYFNAI